MTKPYDLEEGEAASLSVSVIIVTFNSQATLPDCLGSIPAAAEVVVVDNSPQKGCLAVAGALRPDAKLIDAGANRGFGAGCNLGAANATGDVYVFLNPDASLLAGSLQTLAQAAIEMNALVGPTILDESGNEWTCARNHSNMMMDIAGEFLPKLMALGPLARDIPPSSGVYISGGPVPYVQGSCMAISRENFWGAGGFDERYFLYYEEETLARSLNSMAVPVILEPRAGIVHIGAVSTSQMRNMAVAQLYRSKALFYVQYSSRISSFLFCATMWILLQLMAVGSPVRRRIGIRAVQDREWYRAAASGIIRGWLGQIARMA